MAKRPKRPLVIVQTNPQEITKGGLLTVSARLFDPDTNQPMTVSRIFMNIISKNDGHIVWPLEVVRKDTDRFDIVIGTNDMKEGHEYFLRVSNNWNLSPNGSTTFKIRKDGVLPIILSPIAIPTTIALDKLLTEFLEKKQTALELENILRLRFPTLSDKNIEELKELLLHKAKDFRQPVDSLAKREILKYIFRTQMDHRVCPICKETENEEYAPNESKPIIPRHINCRCTYDVIFKEADEVFEASFKDIAQVVTVSRISDQEKMQNLKLIRIVEAVEKFG